MLKSIKEAIKALWEYTHNGYEDLTETLINDFLWASILCGVLHMAVWNIGKSIIFSVIYFASLTCIYHAILVISRTLALLTLGRK